MAAVWLDCDGTLVAFDRPYGELIAAAFEAVAGDVPAGATDVYSERFFEAFRSFEADPYRRGMAAAVERAGVDADPGALAAALYEVELDAVAARPGVRDLLEALADAGHRIGLLTNGVARVQLGKLDRVGLRGCLDATVVSYDVGAHKPSGAVFAAARDALDADRHVMIGDSVEHDVEGARAAGFEAVHLAADGTGDAPGGAASTTLPTLAALVVG